ncbi:MAG: hypothetical protein V3W18_06390, partial [candidate division Zixibacteria bacterium]
MKKLFLLIFAVTLLCTWSMVVADNSPSTSTTNTATIEKVSQEDIEANRAEKDALVEERAAERQKARGNTQPLHSSNVADQPLKTDVTYSPGEKARIMSEREAAFQADRPANSFFDSSVKPPEKPDINVTPSAPDQNVILQGGDTCDDATPIPGLPYTDDGTTVGYTNDYDAVCNFSGSLSPDVVYSYTPEVDVAVDITLCAGITDYDTKLYVYENTCGSGEVYCNDDDCVAPGGQSFVSALYCVTLYAGNTYFIVVDGYGSQEGNYTIEITECVIPEGACCIDLECTETIEADCAGDWYEGQTCDQFECPLVGGIECPDDGSTLFAQPPTPVDGAWGLGTSEIDVQGNNYRRFESYQVSGSILDVHWWGTKMVLDGSWVNCSEEPMTFEIAFWNDDGSGMPDVSAPVCIYQLSAMAMPTGGLYNGLYIQYQFEVDLPQACNLQSGWVSIMGLLDPSCWFMWASSDVGDGSSWFENNFVFEAYAYDNAICLTGDYIPTYGACCDDQTGICNDGVDMLDCPEPLRFAANEVCANLDPACGDTGCPEDVIDIAIRTDVWGSETSWDLVDSENNVLASGGGYADETLYEYTVCVPAGDCYTFNVYDAYGDGFTTNGYASASYNGVEECYVEGNYGTLYTCNMGECEPDPTGACCVAGDCTPDVEQADCVAQLGWWFAGEDCVGLITCPVPTTNCDTPIYENGDADGVNGSRPTVGWDQTGLIDDFQLETEITGDCIRMELISDDWPTGPTVIRARIYEIPGSFANMSWDANGSNAVHDQTYDLLNGLAMFYTGVDYFGREHVLYDMCGPQYTLPAGNYGLLITFPGYGAASFWATCPPVGNELA